MVSSKELYKLLVLRAVSKGWEKQGRAPNLVELRKYMGVSDSFVRNIIRELESEGLLRRQRYRAGKMWVTKAGTEYLGRLKA